MNSKLKALCLGLVAAFAMSAVMASAASALNHHFVGKKGDQLSAAALTNQVFEPTTGSGEGYKCEKVSLESGEVEEQNEEATQTSVTVEPKYDKCTAFPSGAAVEVRQNECHYLFTGETTAGNVTEDGEHANVHIVCPEGKEIEIRVTELKLKCSNVPSQVITDAVHYDNETTNGEGEDGKTHVRVTATAHGIHSTTVGFACESEEEPKTHTNGSYVGQTTVTAPNGVSITNT